MGGAAASDPGLPGEQTARAVKPLTFSRKTNSVYGAVFGEKVSFEGRQVRLLDADSAQQRDRATRRLH